MRRALGADTVHVLGISWGGFLGLMYADPDRGGCLRQWGLHGPRRGQRSARGDARAVGRLSFPLGRLAFRRRQLSARVRNHPPSLLLRQAARGREPHGAGRHASPHRRA
ncbi:MAG: hypothetical protein DME16_08690 [Candidatus Rokuibacteriota bacterium]|nr:MAG: hypothetical protein DME16_08690 [Candidatus Rokubacteria bacterium]